MGKAGLGAAGAQGPGERGWGLTVERALGWEEVDRLKGYFGDC